MSTENPGSWLELTKEDGIRYAIRGDMVCRVVEVEAGDKPSTRIEFTHGEPVDVYVEYKIVMEWVRALQGLRDPARRHDFVVSKKRFHESGLPGEAFGETVARLWPEQSADYPRHSRVRGDVTYTLAQDSATAPERYIIEAGGKIVGSSRARSHEYRVTYIGERLLGPYEGETVFRCGTDGGDGLADHEREPMLDRTIDAIHAWHTGDGLAVYPITPQQHDKAPGIIQGWLARLGRGRGGMTTDALQAAYNQGHADGVADRNAEEVAAHAAWLIRFRAAADEAEARLRARRQSDEEGGA